jgi:hypothetical protein
MSQTLAISLHQSEIVIYKTESGRYNSATGTAITNVRERVDDEIGKAFALQGHRVDSALLYIVQPD